MNEALQPPLSVYRRYAPLLSVLVLVACCISTIVTALGGTVELGGTTYDFALDAKHYGAFAITAAAIASFFWLRKYYKYSLALLFALGLCGLVNFTAVQTSMGLTFGELHVGMSPAMLLFGVLVYATSSKKINLFLLALVKPSDKKITQQRQEEIEEFKRKFSRKPTKELEQIVVDNKLVANALNATRQLLRERDSAKVVTP